MIAIIISSCVKSDKKKKLLSLFKSYLVVCCQDESCNKDVTFHEFYFPMLTPYVQIKELSLRQLILSAEALPCSVEPFSFGHCNEPTCRCVDQRGCARIHKSLFDGSAV